MLRIGHAFQVGDRHVMRAVQSGDRAWLAALVQRQLRAGADLVDVCVAGIGAEAGPILSWCVALAESAGGRAVMIDSDDIELLCATAANCAYRPWLNSVDVGQAWPKGLRDSVDAGCRLVVQLREGNRIPETAADRLRCCERALQLAHGLPLSSIWIDAVALPWGSDLERGRALLDFLSLAGERWPKLQTLIGLSNLSYGHADRAGVHSLWLAELRARGLGGALLDPFDPALMAMCA